MILKKEKLNEALSRLRQDYQVVLPVGEGEKQAYAAWDGQAAPNFAGNTVVPPKDVLFPRSEELYDMDITTGEVKVPSPDNKTVLVGARPCDVQSIGNLDSAFLEGQYRDSNYAARRGALTTVAMACVSVPSRTCFCSSMGGDPLAAPLADVLLTEVDDGYLVEAQSDKGKEIEALWKDLLAESKAKKPQAPALELKVDKPAELPKILMERFEDPMWDALSEACLGCGCCSFICPTCYCFDIDRTTGGSDVTTFRCWDSCMFSDYSRMAGGHNPRPSKKERLRNRYLHKLAYFDERYGKTLCVGCGRCIEKCPAGLDITRVIEYATVGEGVKV